MTEPQTSFLVPANKAESQLASAISASDTSLTLVSNGGTVFPGTYPFHITVSDQEIIEVTAKSGDGFTTISRAKEGTTAVAHKQGATVRLHVTAQAISDLNTAVNNNEFVWPVWVTGTADDVAINTAITAANAAGGGTVKLGPGTYDIQSSVIGLSNVTLDLSAGAILKLHAGISQATADAALSFVVKAYYATRFVVLGGEIDGNKANQSTLAEPTALNPGAWYFEGVFLLGCTDSGVRGTYIHDCADPGVYYEEKLDYAPSQTINRNFVEDCLIVDNWKTSFFTATTHKWQVYWDATSVGTIEGICRGNRIVAPAGTGGINAPGITVKCADVQNDPLASDGTSLSVNTDYGTRFVAGDILKIGTEHVYVSVVTGDTLTITRAYDGTTAAEHANGTDIFFYRPANLDISSNQVICSGLGTTGIQAMGQDHVRIVNNTSRGFATGIGIGGINGQVEGNSIQVNPTSTAGYGVLVNTGSSRMRISGNDVDCNAATNTNGIETYDGCDHIRIEGNTVKNPKAGKYCINVRYGSTANTYVKILGNELYAATGDGGGVAVNTLTLSEIAHNDIDVAQTAISLTSSTVDVHQNSGYVSEARGTWTVANGATSTVVTHGLSFTPAAGDVIIWFASLGNAASCYVDTYTSTQFTVHTNADPGAATATGGWSATKS